MDFASRVDGGIKAGAQGVTASQPSFFCDGLKPPFLETSLHAPHSHRITFADEIRSLKSSLPVLSRRICTGGTNTDPRVHAAAEGLSRRVAKLRRGDRDTIADFFGQQRFWTWEN